MEKGTAGLNAMRMRIKPGSPAEGRNENRRMPKEGTSSIRRLVFGGSVCVGIRSIGGKFRGDARFLVPFPAIGNHAIP